MENIKENRLPKIYIADNAEDNNIIDYFKNSLNFDFGLYFTSNAFMPFFGEKEIGLIEATDYIDEIEDGDICLLVDKIKNKYWLATKEKTGFFTLDC